MAYIKATARLSSVGPYGQSKAYFTEKLEGESHSDYEHRTWRDRAHVDTKGNCYIPGIAFAKSLQTAAKARADKIKGKGQQTWSKSFVRGVQCSDRATLDVTKDEIKGTHLFVPSDGKPGGAKRVHKIFPTFDAWKDDVEFFILDPELPEDVFQRTLESAGMLIGVGFWRPERGGNWGRFKVDSLAWEMER